jgi:hypothetical protein
VKYRIVAPNQPEDVVMAIPAFLSNISAPSTTYAGRGIAKQVAGALIAGAGDAASSATAYAKASVLEELLQRYASRGDIEWNDKDIGDADVLQAIAYVRGKKLSKMQRKAVIGSAKFGLQVAATVGLATVGSVVPVAGTAIGAAGGFIAGRSLSVGVTIADQAKRKAKGFYKLIRGTRGEHRKQAAACLMHCATHPLGWKQAAAIGACSVILGEEYDSVIGSHNVTRLADRLKSN